MHTKPVKSHKTEFAYPSCTGLSVKNQVLNGQRLVACEFIIGTKVLTYLSFVPQIMYAQAKILKLGCVVARETRK